MVEERFLLAKERIREIQGEELNASEYGQYFHKEADFLSMICEVYRFVSV